MDKEVSITAIHRLSHTLLRRAFTEINYCQRPSAKSHVLPPLQRDIKDFISDFNCQIASPSLYNLLICANSRLHLPNAKQPDHEELKSILSASEIIIRAAYDQAIAFPILEHRVNLTHGTFGYYNAQVGYQLSKV